MKLKDLISVSKNSSNKQVKWNIKKRKLKENGITEDDLLNIKLDFKLKECLK
jgi:putative lipase involved disintegration of autophagic bodies